jgi:hypothetical protein
VVRVDPNTREQKAFVIDEAPTWSVRDTAFDGKRIWVCVNEVPAMVAILDPETSNVQTLYFGNGDELKLCTSIAFDGTSMWVGLDTMPAILIRVDPETLNYRVVRFPEKTSCSREMILAGGALWVGLYTVPGKVVRLDPVTERYEILTFPKAYYLTRDLACDGKNIWIGFQNMRYGPSALYRLPMAKTYDAGEKFGPVKDRPGLTPADSAPADDGRKGIARLTSQDWYRVRRGEDDLAWGKTQRMKRVPKVVLSLRASHELAFLKPQQRAAVFKRLETLSADPKAPESNPIHLGFGRRLSWVGEDLRIVYRPDPAGGDIVVSTIRRKKGQSFDPEHMGPPPRW